MKNYEEMARQVLEARDEYIRKKRKKQAMIRRYASVVSNFCFAVLIGFGVWHHMCELPRIPTQIDTIEDTAGNTEPTTEPIITDISAESQTDPNTTSEQAIQGETTAESTKSSETEHFFGTKKQTESEQRTEDQQTEQMTDDTPIIITDPVITVPVMTEPIVTKPVMTEPEITESQTELSADVPATTESTVSSVPDSEPPAEDPNINPNPLHWDEMTIDQQYNMAEFGEPISYYMTAEKEVYSDEIDEFICMAYMSGYDFYSDTYYHCEARVYQMKNHSNLEVIAIQFEGDDTYYLYTLAEKTDNVYDDG